MKKFIVLRADDVDLEFFFEELTKSIHYDFKSVDENSRLTLNSELVENIINSMDSEWDKNIVRVILGSTQSRAEINKLGIDSHDIKQLTEKVLEVLEERKNAKVAASDMVTLRLKSRMESIDSNINSKELTLQRKTHDWTEHQLGELSDDITSLKEQKDLEKLLNPSTKYEKGLVSLQTCYLQDNMKVLDEHKAKLNLEETLSHLRGLKAVLQMLQGQLPNENGKDTKQSSMDFNETFALFLSYSKDTSSLDLGQRHKRKRFKELLCHPKYGLCVYVVMKKFIVLRADDVDLEFLFEELTKSIHYDFKSVDENSRLTLNSELVENINSMDSEWDKNIVRVILGST